MAVTYGFFNSVNGDRKYNADQMSEYFRGIVSQGVFQHLDSGMAVSAGTGLSVSVAAGRAIIQNRWVQNSAALNLTISDASETYGRKDAVVIRLDKSSRAISIAVKTGTPAASPVAPEMTRTDTTYEMALAYVNVAAGASSVTVTDKRSDSSVCGWAAVAQATSGEVDQMLNDMKTGFDGVVYDSPVEMVQGCDQFLSDAIMTVDDNILSIINNGKTVFDPESFVPGYINLVTGNVVYTTPPCAPILDKNKSMVKLFSNKVKVTIVSGYKIRGAIYNEDGTFSEMFHWISDASSYPAALQNKSGKYIRAYANKTDGSNLTQSDYDNLSSVYSITCENITDDYSKKDKSFYERSQTSGIYSDFNSITTNGSYLVNSTLSNGYAGESNYQGNLNVFTWSANNGFGSTQIYTEWNGEMYSRVKWGNTWTNWVHVTDRSSIFAERTQTTNNYTDFNDITPIGAYLVNSALTNGFEGSASTEYRGTLLVFHWKNGNGYGLVQMYYNNDPNKLYIRNLWGSTWSKWDVLITSENIKLYGAKIVNFGDSIFGNKRPPYDISTALAKLTGATVYNLGFGGCRMSQNDQNWDAFSMYRLAYSVAHDDFSVQDAVDITTSGLPSYFTQARTLLESIDFSEVDIVTIAYGTNDFTAGVPLNNLENLYDVTTFEGALRYSLEQLLTAYPQLKIYVCTPTYRFWMESGVFVEDSDTKIIAGQKLTDFVESVKDVTKSYHLTCIDNYYQLGINKFNRSHWFPADDGTHHNQLGAILIAQHMANELF